ncbi:hypothetical protein BHE74_00047175 [Ensete ventricosum]|nr:hypothetical protein BHE74_00047175 [Ensete ventricosum]RZR91522.1 hypothetical protein BHM03_00019642 [Ensete ventricosum]
MAAHRGNSPKGVTAHGRGQLRLTRKRLPTVHPQGPTASGQPARGCRQQGQWHRPQGWRRRSQRAAPPPAQGQRRRWRRKRVKERVRASF